MFMVSAARTRLSRYVSLASLVAAACAPVVYLLGAGGLWYGETPIALAMAVMAGLLAWRHHENIRRLLQGTESRWGRKGASAAQGAEVPAGAAVPKHVAATGPMHAHHAHKKHKKKR